MPAAAISLAPLNGQQAPLANAAPPTDTPGLDAEWFATLVANTLAAIAGIAASRTVSPDANTVSAGFALPRSDQPELAPPTANDTGKHKNTAEESDGGLTAAIAASAAVGWLSAMLAMIHPGSFVPLRSGTPATDSLPYTTQTPHAQPDADSSDKHMSAYPPSVSTQAETSSPSDDSLATEPGALAQPTFPTPEVAITEAWQALPDAPESATGNHHSEVPRATVGSSVSASPAGAATATPENATLRPATATAALSSSEDPTPRLSTTTGSSPPPFSLAADPARTSSPEQARELAEDMKGTSASAHSPSNLPDSFPLATPAPTTTHKEALAYSTSVSPTSEQAAPTTPGAILDRLDADPTTPSIASAPLAGTPPTTNSHLQMKIDSQVLGPIAVQASLQQRSMQAVIVTPHVEAHKALAAELGGLTQNLAAHDYRIERLELVVHPPADQPGLATASGSEQGFQKPQRFGNARPTEVRSLEPSAGAAEEFGADAPFWMPPGQRVSVRV